MVVEVVEPVAVKDEDCERSEVTVNVEEEIARLELAITSLEKDSGM